MKTTIKKRRKLIMSNEHITRDENLDVQSMMSHRMAQKNEHTPAHGDYVPGKNGEVGGILIDEQEVIRRQTENPKLESIKDKLSEMDREIAGLKSKAEGNQLTEEHREREILAKANPNVPEFADISKVSAAFAEFDLSANGLAPKGSKEAVEYQKKMEYIEKNGGIPEVPEEPVKNNVPQVQAPTQAVEENKPEPVVEQHVIQSEETSGGNTVTFNVDSKNVKSFMGSLTDEELSKVVRSDTIVINEIKNLDVPTSTRTITSFDEFKRILPKQSHSGVIDAPLINSGFVATFKGCGALAMATLVPNDINESMDYAKQYSFCYENLVSTSIGKMSFNDFCARVHVNDLPTCLLTILRASDPDENSIVLECADCNNNYEVKYRLTQLIDPESITDEMNEQLEKIMAAKNVFENALEVHNASPVMNTKYVQLEMGSTKFILQLKPTNGNTVIERFGLLRTLAERYSRFVAGIIVYVPKITVQFIPDGETKEVVYDITDPFAIAEIIKDFDTTSVRALGQMLNELVEYPSPTYSFKGPYKCPKCGRDEQNIPCTIESLIFYRVEQAIR